MRSTHATAELHLNGTNVGTVTLDGADASWGYGHFQPLPAFAPFAPLFGQWSLLMHADDDEKRLSEAASEELRQAECAIDALDAKLYWTQRQEWMPVAQLNIDGNLIEWKRR